MPAEKRAIELEVEVAGTPEEVWQAIATGPGISSWYVPHTVEEHEGGSATASFGPGPEMQVTGRVAAWDPPRRIVFDGGEGVPGLAFEWLVEARDGGSCIVRLVNTGFGDGAPWDDQYDQMHEGWKVFLRNLQLHLRYFRGRTATPLLPMAMWAGTREEVWQRLTTELGLPAEPIAGERLSTAGRYGAPQVAGTVVESGPAWVVMLLDDPAPGVCLVMAESTGPATGVSVWSYLYGEEGAAAAAEDGPRWWSWLTERAVQQPA